MTGNSLVKRAVDVIASALGIVVAAPVCLILLLVIRLESPGSPLFVQLRVGRDQKLFRIMKLRTMSSDTGDLPSHHVGVAQITRFGRLLRKLKLDELPQLINVLAGSMSLVGPRPCLPSQAELIEARATRGLFGLRPGITGPAQVVGVDMSEPVRLAEVEHSYFRRANLWSDAMILTRTVLGAGVGDAALGLRSSDLPQAEGDKDVPFRRG